MSEPIMVGGYDLSKAPKGNRRTRRIVKNMKPDQKTTSLKTLVKQLEERKAFEDAADSRRLENKGVGFIARLTIVVLVVGFILLAIFA
jgi:hypothetical protein